MLSRPHKQNVKEISAQKLSNFSMLLIKCAHVTVPIQLGGNNNVNMDLWSEPSAFSAIFEVFSKTNAFFGKFWFKVLKVFLS